MRHSIRSSLAATAIAGLASRAVGAQPVSDIADLAAARGITISGAVTDVFGNSFVLQDASGRVLVDTGPHWYRDVAVRAGERLTVTGSWTETISTSSTLFARMATPS